MADFTKYLRLPTLSEFILLGVLVWLLSQRACDKYDQNKANKELAQMIKDQKDTTHVEKNTQGEDVFYRRQVTGSLENMEKLLTKDSLDNLAQRFNTLSKRIAEYTQVVSRIRSNVPLAEQKTVYITPSTDLADTCKTVDYMTGKFQSPYDTIDVRLGTDPYLHKISIDTLEVLSKSDKEGGLFNRRWFNTINVIGRNPDATYKITGSYKVYDQKAARWSVVIYGGAGIAPVNSLKVNAQVGIGLGYTLFSIKK